ncbi:MAG: Gfo/Idh/MocA family oxidoreductase [Cyclobacteriaceae bacterium]
MLKILIVGWGSIAKQHVQALHNLNRKFELYRLVRNNSSDEQRFIKSYKHVSAIDVQLDFAIIANPSSLHARTIEALSVLDIPLFVEKPFVTSISELETVLQIINKKQLVVYVAHCLRFLGCLRFLESYIRNTNRQINEVNAYFGSYLPDWRPGQDYRLTYSTNKSLGGGVDLDLIHEPDYVYWLFGLPINVKKVISNRSHLKLDVPDMAHLIFEYDDFMAFITVNYYRKDTKRTMEIVMEDQTLDIDLIENTVISSSGELLYKGSPLKEKAYLDDQMNYFLSNYNGAFDFNNPAEAGELLKLCI